MKRQFAGPTAPGTVPESGQEWTGSANRANTAASAALAGKLHEACFMKSQFYSHSIAAGGLDDTSYTTRDTHL